MKSSSIAVAVLVCCAGAAVSQADPILGLFNTGVDAGGNALPGGTPDPHYTVVSTSLPAYVMTTPVPGTYVPNNAGSMWIWENANGQPTNTTRTFRITFDLTGYDYTTASINGLWGTDNAGPDILINGVSTGNTSATFTNLTAFSITSGFVAGINTIDFVVTDVGVISGFRVDQIVGTVSVPTPGVAALLGLGGLASMRRRRA